MDKFFKLSENNTTFKIEVMAGLTTFFAMSYIIFVNPALLSQTGIPYGAVFLATIFASIAGTLVMGLFANVPYAQAPGMGLNAFFVYTVCFYLRFSWQEALAMVFLCGIINIIITVSKLRKMIIKAIPVSLQHAIGGGIGVFIAYIALKSGGFFKFLADPGHFQLLGSGKNTGIVVDSTVVPALVDFNTAGILLSLIGITIMFTLNLLKVPGAVLIGIVATTILGIPMGIVDLSALSTTQGVGQSFSELGSVIGAAFGAQGMGSLFSDSSRYLTILMTIFAFSLSDTFDTLGTFIGTGRRSGIFSAEDEIAMESSSGFKSKMDKALFADSIATSIGAFLGTSNTTTYVESAAGIEAGGRTGLVSVVTSVAFLLSIFIAPIASLVPPQATCAALLMVGIMMLSAFGDIKWDDLEESIPAFFSSIFMALAYNISYGIAFGFASYLLVKIAKRKWKDLNPILVISTLLFVLNFIVLALLH